MWRRSPPWWGQSDIGSLGGVSQMQVSRLLSGIVARLRVIMLDADRAA